MPSSTAQLADIQEFYPASFQKHDTSALCLHYPTLSKQHKPFSTHNMPTDRASAQQTKSEGIRAVCPGRRCARGGAGATHSVDAHAGESVDDCSATEQEHGSDQDVSKDAEEEECQVSCLAPASICAPEPL